MSCIFSVVSNSVSAGFAVHCRRPRTAETPACSFYHAENKIHVKFSESSKVGLRCPSSRRLPKGSSSDARPYHPKCFRDLRKSPFSTVENWLLQKQPIKVHVSANIYYLLFTLLFSSAKSAWPSANPIIEAIIPIKKKLSVCKSTRLKFKLSLMP